MQLTRDTILHTTGQVYVTQAAWSRYARWAELEPEDARREMTEIILDATWRKTMPDGLEDWRLRSRREGVDISLTVSREGRLAVIVSANVRGY